MDLGPRKSAAVSLAVPRCGGAGPRDGGAVRGAATCACGGAVLIPGGGMLLPCGEATGCLGTRCTGVCGERCAGCHLGASVGLAAGGDCGGADCGRGPGGAPKLGSRPGAVSAGRHVMPSRRGRRSAPMFSPGRTPPRLGTGRLSGSSDIVRQPCHERRPVAMCPEKAGTPAAGGEKCGASRELGSILCRVQPPNGQLCHPDGRKPALFHLISRSGAGFGSHLWSV